MGTAALPVVREASDTSIFSAGDPSLYKVTDGHKGGILLLGLHAGSAVPQKLRCYPLFNDAAFFETRHEAVDLGVAPVLDLMAERLGMPSWQANYSRLVSDLNRCQGTHITESTDQGVIVANTNDPVFGRQRLGEVFNPSRQSIVDMVAKYQPRFIFDLHSAYGTQGTDKTRKFDIGVLHTGHTASEILAKRFVEILQAQNPDLDVKENYPYNPHPSNFNGIHICATELERLQVPVFLIELNQDQVATDPDQQKRYADILSTAVDRLHVEVAEHKRECEIRYGSKTL